MNLSPPKSDYFCSQSLKLYIVKELILLISVMLFGNLAIAQHGSHRCGTTDYTEYQIAKDPSIKISRDSIEIEIQKYIKNNFDNTSKAIITIPVVIHVLYNNSSQNISDAQIYSQIDVLNEDYRRLNTDTTYTPLIFKSIAADAEIEFCLAKQDPQGNYTSGITRTQTTKTSFDLSSDDAKHNSTGGHDIWDRNKYLNIWVVPAIKDGSVSGILGYAQFPGGPSATDGVVIQYRNFGRIGNLSPYYNKGRTVTHEVGHWLDLYHIWGDDGNGCWGSDYVDDTPNQADENYNCPNFPASSCSNTSDMYSNYMDYTDDDCMNIFTVGQKARMVAILNGARGSLKSSPGCLLNSIKQTSNSFTASIIPNPTTGVFTLSVSENIEGRIDIYNSIGELVSTNAILNQNQKNIDISNFPSGLYFGIIRTEKSTIIKKIQILK